MQPPASKPSKLFIPISAGLSDHMGDGRITPNMFCVYWAMLYGADYETGIWKGCAEKIRLYWNGSLEIRAIQRAMKSLSEGGYTKSFQKNGERGNYPVAINKYPVRFGVHKGKRLNAALMPDPSSPVYEDDPRQPKEKGVTSAAPPKPISQRSAKPQTQSYNDRVRSGVNNRDDDAEENAAIPVTSGDYKDNHRDSGAKNERDMSPTSEPTSVLHSIPEVPEVSEGLEVPDFGGGGGGGTNLSSLSSRNQTPSGNDEAILKEIREIWHRKTYETYNDNPKQQQQILTFARQYGPDAFLNAFEEWAGESDEQIRLKDGSNLTFP
ncbi:MAG: hypothetical protein WB660_23605, partial [Candidatus Sulfotelmatobacter sp.]